MALTPPSPESLPSCNHECTLYRAKYGAEELLLTDPDVPEVAKLLFLESKQNRDHERAMEIARRDCDGRLLPDGQCPRVGVYQAMRSLYGGEIYPVAMKLASDDISNGVAETTSGENSENEERKIVEVVGLGDAGVDVRLDDEVLRANPPLARAVIEIISQSSGLREIKPKERLASRSANASNFLRSHVIPVAYYAGSTLIDKFLRRSR